MSQGNKLLALPLAIDLLLSACGGDSGGVASTPAPPNLYIANSRYTVQNQLAPAPAWTTGNYQGIAVFRNELNGDLAQAPAGSVGIAVDTAAKTYALTVTAGSVSVAPVLLSSAVGSDYGDASPYIGTRVKVVHQWSDGVARPGTDEIYDVTVGRYQTVETISADHKVRESYLTVSSVPGRHVSLGHWDLRETPLNPDGSRGVTNAWTSGEFAFGDRTAPGDIPVTGTARYTVETPPSYSEGDALIRSAIFDVDFGARSIAARYALSGEAGLYPEGVICCLGSEETIPDPATRVGTIALATNASGAAPFSLAGDFDISLAGNALVHVDRLDHAPVADISSPVAGTISGAFFGPQAGELGGTYVLPTLPTVDGAVNSGFGAFTAVQSKP